MEEAEYDRGSVLSRIRRDREESEKFTAEQKRLFAEARNLERVRWLAAIIAIGGLIVGALGTAVGFVAVLLRH